MNDKTMRDYAAESLTRMYDQVNPTLKEKQQSCSYKEGCPDVSDKEDRTDTADDKDNENDDREDSNDGENNVWTIKPMNGETDMVVINPAFGEGVRGVKILQQAVPFRMSKVKVWQHLFIVGNKKECNFFCCSELDLFLNTSLSL